MPRRKKKIAVIDSETDPFKKGRILEPFAWGFYDGEIYEEFWGEDGVCSENLVRFLEDEEYLIYAHNGGNFDYYFLLEYLSAEVLMINGRISKASIYGNELRDSYSILPLPLKAHQKQEFDYDKMEREVRYNNVDEISDYLKSDCFNLYDWVTKFTDRFGRKLTLASTAFSEIKKTGYEIGRTSQYYDALFREYYYGGRVQCFEVGNFYGQFEYVDINSAYPFAMLENHPYGNEYYDVPALPKNHGAYFAHVKAISRGALPVRGEDGRLHYPNDDEVREYKVTGWEIIAGLETHTLEIVKIIRVIKFHQTKDFSAYINKCYDEKLEAEKNNDAESRLFAKNLMNAGYGKFGMDGRKFKDYEIHDYGDYPEDNDPAWVTHMDLPTGHTVFERPNPQDSFYNVATAASITGYVRAYLWRAICASDRPLYCDTDSIICEKFNGVIGDALGEWSYEGDGNKLTEAHIAQRKMYAVLFENSDKYKVASKGVKISSEEIIEGIRTGNDILVERDTPSFSLKYGYTHEGQKFGQRYLDRRVKFSEIYNR